MLSAQAAWPPQQPPQPSSAMATQLLLPEHKGVAQARVLRQLHQLFRRQHRAAVRARAPAKQVAQLLKDHVVRRLQAAGVAAVIGPAAAGRCLIMECGGFE